MLRLAWLTDIHLNFLEDSERRRFLETVATQADALAISGDIGESPSSIGYLQEMEEILRKPIYFVLGNHDFYFPIVTCILVSLVLTGIVWLVRFFSR